MVLVRKPGLCCLLNFPFMCACVVRHTGAVGSARSRHWASIRDRQWAWRLLWYPRDCHTLSKQTRHHLMLNSSSNLYKNRHLRFLGRGCRVYCPTGKGRTWQLAGLVVSKAVGKGFDFLAAFFAAWALWESSSGCLAWLLCYLWTAKLQVGAAALIQLNTANLCNIIGVFWFAGLFSLLLLFSPNL